MLHLLVVDFSDWLDYQLILHHQFSSSIKEACVLKEKNLFTYLLNNKKILTIILKKLFNILIIIIDNYKAIRILIKHKFFIILYYYVAFVTLQFLYSFFTFYRQLVTISRFTTIIPCILTEVLFWRKNEFDNVDSFGVTTSKKLDRQLLILNTIQEKALNVFCQTCWLIK